MVETIHILYTVLTTKDNARIIVPNGQLANSSLKNISRNTERRVDLEISVAYGTSGEKVKEILKDLADNHSKILHEKVYTIRMCRHNVSSLDYNYRVWVKKENYWDVYYDLLEEVVARFEKEDIEIPYQKIDIYNKYSKKYLRGEGIAMIKSRIIELLMVNDRAYLLIMGVNFNHSCYLSFKFYKKLYFNKEVEKTEGNKILL